MIDPKYPCPKCSTPMITESGEIGPAVATCPACGKVRHGWIKASVDGLRYFKPRKGNPPRELTKMVRVPVSMVAEVKLLIAKLRK